MMAICFMEKCTDTHTPSYLSAILLNKSGAPLDQRMNLFWILETSLYLRSEGLLKKHDALPKRWNTSTKHLYNIHMTVPSTKKNKEKQIKLKQVNCFLYGSIFFNSIGQNMK